MEHKLDYNTHQGKIKQKSSTKNKYDTNNEDN